MSLALGHFAFGAAMTTLLLLLLPPIRYPRTVVTCGGLWAMLPDVYWLSPIARESIYGFHQTSPLVDLFWFHRALDAFDAADSPRMAAAVLAVFAFLTLVSEWRDARASSVVDPSHDLSPGSRLE